jgi:hypothetical protein
VTSLHCVCPPLLTIEQTPSSTSSLANLAIAEAVDLQLLLQRALQDTPDEDKCGSILPQGSLGMSEAERSSDAEPLP